MIEIMYTIVLIVIHKETLERPSRILATATAFLVSSDNMFFGCKVSSVSLSFFLFFLSTANLTL